MNQSVKKSNKRLKLSDFPVYVLLIAGALLVCFPMYLTIITSLKSPPEIAQNFFALPKSLYLENFQHILSQAEFSINLKNSLLVTVVSVAVIVLVNPMVAYAIARKMDRSKFYKGLYLYFLLALFVPFQVVMMPLVLLLQKINFMNVPGLIVCYLAFSLSQSVFLYTGYIRAVPLDLEEASFLDGCTIPQTFFKIVLPLIKPMTATIIILNALWIWNDFMLPLLVLSKSSKMWTLPLFIYNFKSQYSIQTNLAFAAFLLALLPIMIMYAFMQRYIIAGMTSGALKG